MRAAIKWTGAVATVLLLAVWVGSRWQIFAGGYTPAIYVIVHAGQLQIGWEKPWTLTRLAATKWRGMHAFRRPYPPDPPLFNWWFHWRSADTGGGITASAFDIPIWALGSLTGVPT